jgi:ABC-2 type transport system ATP-binding protein
VAEVATTGVSARGIVRTYRGVGGARVHAVRGIDLDIEPGSTVALLGPNGAGKSTTIDMLIGLAEPDEGTVTLFGTTPKQAVAAGKVGAMLQTGTLLAGVRVRELVEMVASLYPRTLGVDETLDLCELADIADRRTNKLSGGQSQRVRCAIALVGDPDMLVLDEPTSAMDVESRHIFWRSMRRFTERGTTVLFATHYLEEADEFAERVVLIAKGTVVADGSPASIKARVDQRTIRATLPDVDESALLAIDGVANVRRTGGLVEIRCTDSDAALRTLLARFPQARHIEVRSAGLDEAFLLLTSDATAEAT